MTFPSDCPMCGGERMIMRPAHTITKEIRVEYWDELEMEYRNRLETTTSEVGGLDACPLCAGIAEAEAT